MLLLTCLTSNHFQDVRFLIHRMWSMTEYILFCPFSLQHSASPCEHVTALTDPVISVPPRGGLSSCEGLAFGLLVHWWLLLPPLSLFKPSFASICYRGDLLSMRCCRLADSGLSPPKQFDSDLFRHISSLWSQQNSIISTKTNNSCPNSLKNRSCLF